MEEWKECKLGDICKKYNVKINSTMFHKSPEDVKGIIEVCGLNRLKPNSNNQNNENVNVTHQQS